MTATGEPDVGYLILRLPSLVAGRDLADVMLDQLSTSYDGRHVIVDASRTSSASPSFSGQVVQHVLVDGGAASLLIVGAPDRMTGVILEVASGAGVRDRVQITEHMPRRDKPVPA